MNGARQAVTELRRNALFNYHLRFISLLIIGLLLGERCPAVLELDTTPDSSYQAYASKFQGATLWLKATKPAGTLTNVLGTAVRINDWYALTAAHNIVVGSTTNTINGIGNGTNYISAPGDIRNVASWLIYPTWSATFSGDSVDLAIIKFDQPLLGTNLNISSAAIHEVLSGGGFGILGKPSTGFGQQDFDRRAFDAVVFEFGAGAVFSANYAGLDFSTTYNLPLCGRASSGDSGSPGFDSLGNLAAINVGVVGDPNSTSIPGTTIAVRLGLFTDWITTNTYVPPPTLNFTSDTTNLILSWTGSYILQTATAPNATFADVPASGNPYTNALTATQQYFRLRENRMPTQSNIQQSQISNPQQLITPPPSTGPATFIPPAEFNFGN